MVQEDTVCKEVASIPRMEPAVVHLKRGKSIVGECYAEWMAVTTYQEIQACQERLVFQVCQVYQVGLKANRMHLVPALQFRVSAYQEVPVGQANSSYRSFR